jgi:hypothetical protein
MMSRSKTIPVVQLMLIDFDALARQSEQEILNRFFQICRMTKGMFKRAVRYDGFRVLKGPSALVIDIMLGQERMAQFSFIPPPDFSRMQVQT